MRIGVGLDARLGLDYLALRDLAREAVKLGFESMWTPAGGVPDAFHICAGWSQASAEETAGGLVTGISVVPAARLWPVPALAMQAATVGIISGGRFVLGIGTGGYGDGFWRSVNMPNKPIAVMRDYLICLRRLLSGETVTYQGQAVSLNGVSIGSGMPTVPVYLAALGPQMLRLAGDAADGAALNWATPQQIAVAREQVAAGARKAGRAAEDVKLSMYIRVCIDDDVAAARRAFGAQVLGYALARPGAANTMGYRGMFGSMGFEDVLTHLEDRRAAGASMDALVDEAPDDLLLSVGYFGIAANAPAAYARLSQGLDETIVRVITTKPDADKVRLAMTALTPAKIRAATP